MKNNKGFSLVELIIVIAIMAVLVGVLAPTYLQYVEKSKKSNDVSTVDSIVNACEIGAIDPEVMTDPTLRLIITINNTQMTIKAQKAGANAGTFADMPAATEPSQWQKMLEAAVGSGTDVKLKSTNWEAKNASGAADGTANHVVIIATRNIATGKVDFTYGSDGTNTTAGSFKTYATSLSKIS